MVHLKWWSDTSDLIQQLTRHNKFGPGQEGTSSSIYRAPFPLVC